MESMLKVFAILLGATFIFHTTLNFMEENIEDFETVPLPPKIIQKLTTNNPVIQVDATSKEIWTLVNFASGKTFQVVELEKEKEKLNRIPWDLGFKRTKIISNGGITNPQGSVGVANLGPVDFDAVRRAPESGYLQDTRSFGIRINKSLSGWYNYRTRTHNIESKRNVYVVKTVDGRYMKMRVLNYYCSRKENDCRSVMCRRDEAACLTIEYLLSPEGDMDFPAPDPTRTAQNLPQNPN